MNKAKINTLISDPDFSEQLRDHIASILSLELQNQYEMAVSQGARLPESFDIPVYVENARPYDGSCVKPIQRFVNVTLPKIEASTKNARVDMQKEEATFWIDCAGCGNDSGDFRDDRSSAMRAWKVCRIVRRIIMSSAYTYLGLRGVVGSRIITGMEAGNAPNQDASSLFYTVIRITLLVTFIETAFNTSGSALEGIDYEINPSTGEITV